MQIHNWAVKQICWSHVLGAESFMFGGCVAYCGFILHPTRHKICHFRDVLPSQYLGLVLTNGNKHNKSTHASTTKYTTT